jgi:NAD(P)-dependent dehydrogenase (short-subunit alcohol dehydrogenase family)
MDFTGRIAIVTGAGKGIGRGVSLALAARGAKVVLAGVRDESINQVKAEIEATGGEAMCVRTDVARWEDAQAMVKATMDRYGRIDILVNNAGVDKIDKGGKQYTIEEIEDADWDYVLGVNLKGQFHCAKAVMPVMKAQKKGNIVSISSTTGFQGQIGSPPYCASKAAIMVFNKMLARELGSFGVFVNCVAPGMIITPLHDYTPAVHREMVEKMMPLHRVGYPEDVAQAVLWFCEENLYITGQTLVVDGGGTMR